MGRTVTAQSSPPEKETLRGIVRQVVYRSAASGFTVLRLDTSSEGADDETAPRSRIGRVGRLPGLEWTADPGDAIVTAVGHLPEVAEGELVRVEGYWTSHPRYGRQFHVERLSVVVPETEVGLQRYLASGVIRGVGPATAERLVEHFGRDVLDVIESQPERLTEVPGIGAKKAAAIHKGFVRRRSVERVMVFLQGHGVSPAYATRIWREYGDEAVEVVKANPYRLARDIFGIGFRMADKLARSLGVDEMSPERIGAGLVYVLDRAAEQGHVYLPREELVNAAARELGVPAHHVEATLGEWLAGGLLRVRPSSEGTGSEEGGEDARPERDAIYRPEMDMAEGAVADAIARLSVAAARLRAGSAGADDTEASLKQTVRETAAAAGLALTPEQEEAVTAGLTEGVLVITGGPGTGKTTIVKVLLSLLQRFGQRALLACPTGRAAQRLQEATGAPASTIHRLLEFGYEEGRGLVFQRHQGNPLEADVVIIDEASMVDIRLAYHLLQAISPGTRLIFIGDVDQLPSVGPGDVLRDMIRSEAVRTVRLGRVFRQDEDSGIVRAAHAILDGKDPVDNRPEGDFFLIEEADPERVVDIILDLVSRRLPEFLGVDHQTGIQVLSPMRRTVTGVDHLNKVLQERLNPARGDGAGDLPFRLGDKVMQTRNDYRKQVFNGDIGQVTGWDPEEGMLWVTFPGPGEPQVVEYDESSWDDLSLAYCISVHKSQGSEYPAIVMPVTTQHYVMLRRNLLYTAVTRARRMAVLVGTRRAVRIAVGRAAQERRCTLLAPRLRAAVYAFSQLPS